MFRLIVHPLHPILQRRNKSMETIRTDDKDEAKQDEVCGQVAAEEKQDEGE